jgi:hypothetical protein
VGTCSAITYRLAHHDRNEAVLAAVDRARPDASARRQPRDQDSVDAEGRERRSQSRAEECARILLGDHSLTRDGFETFGEGGELRVRPGFETAQRRNLPKKHATVTPAWLIHHVGVEYGNPSPSRRVKQRLAVASSLFDTRVKR